MRRFTAGMSLIELIVVLALLGGVGLGVGVLIRYGINFYLDSSDGIKVRQNLVFAASQLSRDLMDSQVDVVRSEESDDGAADPLERRHFDSVVFPTLRTPDGSFLFDSKGRSLWQSYICYYYDTSVTPNRLMKRVVDIPRGPHPFNPPAGLGELIPPDPLNEIPARNSAWFLAQSGLSQKVVARDLHSFDIDTTNVDLVKYTIGVSVSTRRENRLQILSSVKPRR